MVARARLLRSSAGVVVLWLVATPAAAQTPDPLAAERDAFAEWLATAEVSPAAAVAMVRVGPGVTVGPAESQVPLPGLPPLTVRPLGPGMRLDSAGTTRPIPRYRTVALGRYSFYISGTGDRTTLVVYRPRGDSGGPAPAFYPYRPEEVREVVLDRTGAGRRVAMLALDGQEVDAFVAGTVAVLDGDDTTHLEVRHVPDPATEETELQIYFRDATNGDGSYPAGRFVPLVPIAGDRYRLDFNAARNPFCAYSTVYPCPVPWPGNRLTSPVAAGERYTGGGLDPAVEDR